MSERTCRFDPDRKYKFILQGRLEAKVTRLITWDNERRGFESHPCNKKLPQHREVGRFCLNNQSTLVIYEKIRLHMKMEYYI